jgi:hypothetical protein
MTTVLWAQWTVVWKIRNEVIHGKDEAMQRQQRQQEDLRRLRHVYTHKNLMEPSVQELLFDTVVEHEVLPAQLIQNWLSIHKDLVRHSVKLTMQRAIQVVRSIRTCFKTLGDTQHPANTHGQSQQDPSLDEPITTEFAAHLF